MRVRIAHASQSENGNTVGKKGDQTGKEVLLGTFYTKDWSFVAIHPDEKVRDRHAMYAEMGALNDNIGYNWFGTDDRNSLNKEAMKVNYEIDKIKNGCNCDCSSFQNVMAVASKAPGVTYSKSNGWTTRTMKSALQKAGYVIITDSKYLGSEKYAVRGAIYCKEGNHTMCTLDNGSAYKDTLIKAGLIKPTETKPVESKPTTSKLSTTNQEEITDFPIQSAFNTDDMHVDVEAFKSYKVRISISDLNIRTGPGTNYKKTGKYTGKGVFTIVEESTGKGATKWGKLKSEVGWISLDYCTKL